MLLFICAKIKKKRQKTQTLNANVYPNPHLLSTLLFDKKATKIWKKEKKNKNWETFRCFQNNSNLLEGFTKMVISPMIL